MLNNMKNIPEKLQQAGIKWIEVAGRGGTNWASIELARNQLSQEKQLKVKIVISEQQKKEQQQKLQQQKQLKNK